MKYQYTNAPIIGKNLDIIAETPAERRLLKKMAEVLNEGQNRTGSYTGRRVYLELYATGDNSEKSRGGPKSLEFNVINLSENYANILRRSRSH